MTFEYFAGLILTLAGFFVMCILVAAVTQRARKSATTSVGERVRWCNGYYWARNLLHEDVPEEPVIEEIHKDNGRDMYVIRLADGTRRAFFSGYFSKIPPTAS